MPLWGVATRVVMSAVTVNGLLDGHVSLDLECRDRIYLASLVIEGAGMRTKR